MQDRERDHPRRNPDIPDRRPGEEPDTDRFRNLILRDLSEALDFDLGRILERLRRRVPEFRVSVRRPDDLLAFDLIFENLKLIPGSNPRLERSDPKATPTLVVEFPPQSFAEEAFLAVSNADADIGKEVTKEEGYPPKNVPQPGETVPPLPSSRVRMAGPSRLAFSMPKSEADLPFTLPAVLEAMRTWPMRLDISALPDPPLRIIQPFFPKEITLGNFLALVTRAPGWSLMRAELSEVLAETGAEGIVEQIEDSARRVAERAVAGLRGGSRSCLGVVLPEVFQGEIERLMQQVPPLRRGQVREAAIAAVSLASTELLAGSARRFEIGLDEIELIPFLPLLLQPHQPPANVTALELPYRLVTSPIESARWVHSDTPVEHSSRFELWHTRLTTSGSDFGPDLPAKIRAIWSDDYPITEFNPLLAPKPRPFRMTLDPLDRKMLVRLTAGWNEKRGELTYHPRAARTERLHLSSLGALLDAEGNWNPRPTGVDLEQWRHLASLGRDHYVRVVYAGYLCAFGHAASLVKVTERKFEPLQGNPSKRVAVLRQRFFIVCRERVREYTGSSHKFEGRTFPFQRVEILTRVTPDLLEPGTNQSKLQAATGDTIFEGEIVPRMAFWPMVPGAGPGTASDFRFQIRTTDLDGRQVTFSMPLLFVGEVVNDKKDGPIRRAYNASSASRRSADLGGAPVTYAPHNPGDQGDPRLPTAEMTFSAGDLKTGLHFPLAPNFYPETKSAWVGIRPVQKLLAQPNAVVQVAYPTVYRDHGFGEKDPSKNKGRLFLQLINAVHPLEFGEDPGKAKSDALGALASPQMTIQGLSSLMGPVAAQVPANLSDPAQIENALGKVIGNQFDPADFFKGAKILGGVELADILEVAGSLLGADVPKLVSQDFPDRIETRFDWESEIKKSDPLGLLIPNADTGKAPTKLAMHGLVTAPLQNPQNTTLEAAAQLNNFKVNLFGFVIIWFEDLRFSVRNGQKPDVTVDLRQGDDAVQFGGPLEFVNQLRNLIPSNGFSDPPELAVTPSGIAASFSLNLPTVGVGVLTLSNASLGAGFNLPFDSRPAGVNFFFSRREQPFSLTVSLLGGGGFFLIGISTRGVTEIEAALEFGAAVAINLGVASGGVEIKAGIYFHWLEPVPDQGSVELAGYVRLHGELSVLGLISASLTFNLQLAYLKENGGSTVWGMATLVVEVEVLFFSASVSVKCRREFAGSDSDPKFIDLIPNADVWAEYCEAFAEEAA